MSLHSNASLGARHPIHDFEFADTAAREGATGFTDADIGKMARQIDEGSFWYVQSQAGGTPTWAEGTTVSPGGLPDHASNHTDGTDDIQNATSSQKGLATAAQITKLNGLNSVIEIKLPIAGEIDTGDDQTPVPYEVGQDITINEFRVTSRIGPTGSDMTFQVEHSDTSDPPGSFVEVVGPADAKIVAGNRKGDFTLGSPVDVDKGEELILNVDQFGSTIAGSDILVTLIGVKR